MSWIQTANNIYCNRTAPNFLHHHSLLICWVAAFLLFGMLCYLLINKTISWNIVSFTLDINKISNGSIEAFTSWDSKCNVCWQCHAVVGWIGTDFKCIMETVLLWSSYKNSEGQLRNNGNINHRFWPTSHWMELTSEMKDCRNINNMKTLGYNLRTQHKSNSYFGYLIYVQQPIGFSQMQCSFHSSISIVLAFRL